LIEIIVGIVVSAILAVILAQIVGGISLRSYWPVQRIDEKLLLQEVMNDITAEHRTPVDEQRLPLTELQAYMQPISTP
jgi:hypothetical protein